MPPAWSLPLEELAAAFSPKTKMLLLNSPLNPAGKVFTRTELAQLAALAIAHDVFVVCDEVYEHLVFGEARHVPMMTLPGMRERTARIGSAGKTFSITGWKVGYITAPPSMLHPIAKAHQLVTFTTPPSLQHAVAIGLAQDDAFFTSLGANLARSRDRLAAGLTALGIPILPCDGTYFLVADMSRWLRDGEDDAALCRRLVTEVGVVLIPLSAFYEKDAPRGLVRFCFCKLDATIDSALDGLRQLA